MPVIPITVFISLGLVFLFVVLFWSEQRRPGASAERDSLLPLADELPRVVPRSMPADADLRSQPHSTPAVAAGAKDDHRSTHDACGCRDGLRPPCAGCLRQPASA